MAKKSAAKSTGAMPIDAQTAIKICGWYCAFFGFGLAIFTDQLAAGYGIEVSDKSKVRFVALLFVCLFVCCKLKLG